MGIRGNRRYLLAVLDSATGYWVARQVAERKGNDDVRPMFRTAKEADGVAIEGQNKILPMIQAAAKSEPDSPFRFQEDPYHTELTQIAITQRLNNPHSPDHGRGRIQSGYPG